ncbi:MAG: hypothetical protein WB756_08160, partial [Xanthobacteraceae bacterium]
MGYGGASNVEHARDGRIAKLFEEQGQYFLFECFIEASRMATQVLPPWPTPGRKARHEGGRLPTSLRASVVTGFDVRGVAQRFRLESR